MESIVYYDHRCVMCNSVVRFLKRRLGTKMSFVALESEEATSAIGGLDSPDSIIWQYGTEFKYESKAVFEIIKSLPLVYQPLRLFGLLPTSWTDRVYRFVAARRYLIFGKMETCELEINRPSHQDSRS